MASNVIKECLVCTEEFDEDERCPRNLPCSHCFCTSCINQLIVRDVKKCPLCQKTFEAQKTQDLRRNVIAIDLLRYIKSIESKNAIKQPPRSRKELVEEMKTNVIEMNSSNTAAVKDVKDRMQNTIKTNNEIIKSIKEQRMILQNEIMRRIKDLDTQHEAKILYLEHENEGVRKQMKETEEKEMELFEVKMNLDDASTLVSVDAAIDKAESSNVDVKIWLKYFHTIQSRQQKILEGIQKAVNTNREIIRSLRSILEYDDRKNIDLALQLADMRLHHKIHGEVTIKTLKELSSETKHVISLGGVYAVSDGERRAAQISLSGDKILLHCLTKQQLPQSVCTIEHREVMKVVAPSPRLLFLDFGTREKTLGRVFIRTHSESTLSENFSALCTGERGPSYLNSTVHSVWYKGEPGETVVCADDKNNIRRDAEKAVEKGHGDTAETLLARLLAENSQKQPALAGTVYGDLKPSKFRIITRDDPKSPLLRVFGKVESGLHVLSEFVEAYPSITMVEIVDCGVVLTL